MFRKPEIAEPYGGEEMRPQGPDPERCPRLPIIWSG